MEISQALILGVLQGITEFLPISSSGHLILGEELLGLEVEDLKSFDVALHIASLLAIMVYFKRDIWEMILALGRFLGRRLKKDDPYFALIGYILVGTIPAVIVGFTLEDAIDGTFREAGIVVITMFVVGLVFLLGEFAYKKRKGAELSMGKAIVIGLAQAAALIPGVSRSGSTIVAGLFQGIERAKAARFSFLLGIPALVGAGLLTALKVEGAELSSVGGAAFGVGFVSSFVFGLLSIAFLMRFLKRHSLLVFAVYLMLVNVFFRLIS